MIYKHTVLGGTFDRIHDGHISYLRTAFESSENITIGLTTDTLHYKKEIKKIIQPYDLRKSELVRVANTMWPNVNVEVVPIDDIFGPSISSPSFDAIVVSILTLENGKRVNKERVKKGLKKLDIVICPLVQASDNKLLSSTRIRLGEIDRKGMVYAKSFSKTRTLPEKLREELRNPLGTVVKGNERAKNKAALTVKEILENEKFTFTIAVGDVVSSSLEEAGFRPNMKVIDFKTQRKFLPTFEGNKKFNSKNVAGTINAESVNFLEKELKKIIKKESKYTITVDGEEDLLALPAILLAPLESIVFYGQKDVGIVMVKVTEEIKKQVLDLVTQFE